MSIESELTDFLTRQTSGSETADRDSEAVMHHYGFRDKLRPTYEETAHFAGLESKQRAEQILRKYFKSVVKPSDLPGLRRFRRILTKNPYWRVSELHNRCVRRELIGDNTTIQSILDLIKDVGIKHDYHTFTNEFKKIATISSDDNTYFIADASESGKIKSLVDTTLKLPEQNGIANLKHVGRGRTNFNVYIPLLRGMIESQSDSWSREDGDDFWYMFEQRGRNPLRRFAEGVFSLFKQAELDVLADAFHNAFYSRTGKGPTGRIYRYPPRRIVREYLNSSSKYDQVDGKIAYLSSKTINPSVIESDVVRYLMSNVNATSPEIRSYLNAIDHKKDNSIKRVFNSPFVHKSGKRPYYSFNLVGELRHEIIENWLENDETDRYRQFKELLAKLEDTDRIREGNERAEQGILRRWLFEGLETKLCAICWGNFTVAALHAAHKKKRSICSDDERRDPHIVMPICVFGCDFLYEHGHINIRDGMVSAGTPIQHDGPEKQSVAKLINKKIDERWLQGPETYFR